MVRATRSVRCCPRALSNASCLGVAQLLLALLVQPRVPFEHSHVQVRVQRHALSVQPVRLAFACSHHALARLLRARPRRGAQPLVAGVPELDLQVDPVQQRTAQLAPVARDAGFAAAAPFRRPRIRTGMGWSRRSA